MENYTFRADGEWLIRESDGAQVHISASEFKDWVAVGNAPNPYIQTPEQLAVEVEKALDKHIDAVAKADGWDSRITCALRAGHPGPWQAKAIKFFDWMETCYTLAYQIQSDVIAGARPLPTPEQVISELPPMVW